LYSISTNRETKDFTETVRLLAGLTKFADITNSKSAPLELWVLVAAAYDAI
jgi:hypothetical protein